jgi:hypothetical protein
VDKLEKDTGKAIFARPDANAHREKFAIAPADVDVMAKTMKGLKPAKALDLTILAYGTGDDLRAIAWYNGILVDVPNGAAYIGQTLPAKLTKVSRSYMVAELVGVPSVAALEPVTAPAQPEEYPKAAAKADREMMHTGVLEREFSEESRGRSRHRRERPKETEKPEVVEKPETVAVAEPAPVAEDKFERDGRRRRRRRGRREPGTEQDLDLPTVGIALAGEDEPLLALPVTVAQPHPAIPIAVTVQEEEERSLPITLGPARPRRRWQWRRRKGGKAPAGAE